MDVAAVLEVGVITIVLTFLFVDVFDNTGTLVAIAHKAALIGLDANAETITGLFVLDQKETPALGDNIKKPEFCDRFRGKAAGEMVAAVKGNPEGNQIQAITGATVSSSAVCTIVNNAVEQFRQHKGELALEQ